MPRTLRLEAEGGIHHLINRGNYRRQIGTGEAGHCGGNEGAHDGDQLSDVRLELADNSLEKLRISGVFRADNGEGFVELLERTFPLTAERVGSVIVLRRKIQR